MDLSYISISQIHELYKTKKLTPKELVEYYSERIRKYNPSLNAVLDWSEEKALQQVEKLGNFDEKKSLWGIPVLVKDNFVTREFKTTASSNIIRDYYSPFNATVVTNLKKAGAVILGKTNMDAFAHGSSTETSDFGPTKNPWDVNKLPGGSSGGSAAAVVADLCTIAIGSETAGSIRQPAAWCGCVGIKPTYGAVSRWGLILMASSTDCPGVLARSVEDAKIGLAAIAGYDEHDSQSIYTGNGRNVACYVPTTEKIDPTENVNNKNSKITIGICDDYFMKDTQKEVNASVLKAIDEFKKMGFEVKKINLIPPKYAIAVYTILMRSEVSSNLARFDSIRYGKTRDFFNAENSRRILVGTYCLSTGYYDEYYLKSVKVRTLIVENFKKAFEEVDVIIAPTSPSTALKVGASKDNAMFGDLQDVLVEASSIAQLPGINVMCGFDENETPIGMQIVGRWGEEDRILALAESYESMTDWHKLKPKLD